MPKDGSSTRSKPDARRRLPTLNEVLSRVTRPPVDLYCFYIYLQREHNEDSLDFWLDVQQHEKLCSIYFRNLRKQKTPVSAEWPEYDAYARSNGSVYANITGVHFGSARDSVQTQNSRSASDSTHQFLPLSLAHHGNETTLDALNDASFNETTLISRELVDHPLPVKRAGTITKDDLIMSAARIFFRYLGPDSPKRIPLPPRLRIAQFPLQYLPLQADEAPLSGAIPDLFNRQKDYIYRCLDVDFFPRFLNKKAVSNLTSFSSLLRLVLGLFLLWFSFALALSFIFLDTKPQRVRLWVILPLALATILLLSYAYSLDPLIFLAGYSETRPFRFIKVREPHVRTLLLFRALWIIILTVAIVAVLTVILCLVPGHRL